MLVAAVFLATGWQIVDPTFLQIFLLER